jgi:hypothetical protein
MPCRAGRKIMTETELPQSSVSCLPCSPLLAGGRAYTTSNPLIETVQHGRGLAEAEIALPSLKVAAQLSNHGLDADAPSSTSKGSDSSLEPGHSFGRESALRQLPVRKAEPEEFPLPRSRHSTFLPVHLQLELTFKESRQPSHQALPCSPAAYIDVAVVRIPNKAMASSLQLTIKFIENKIR